MTLDSIPASAQVLIDANVLIYARRKISAQCFRFLERCRHREIFGVVTTITVAEFGHRRMIQEAQSLGLSGSNPAKLLAHNHSMVQQLSHYRSELKDLLAGEFAITTIDAVDFHKALELQHQYGFLTNDSLQLAAGMRTGVNRIATADLHFASVPDFTVYSPYDLP